MAYWQPDNESSNAGLLWAGTAQEYVAQLKIFSEAVRKANAGKVVLGGCGYDVFSRPEGSEPRRFFHDLAQHGRDYFDLFSVTLYGDPRRVFGGTTETSPRDGRLELELTDTPLFLTA